ncbi:potassium channel family protein [Modestobacter sp. VKM Ac-2978]|uniref:potassium channel family protein n=1 Tax=Modestobacter sp. VKM Ac-2978 TaxID=3004132 RepID=UPI0022AB2CB8|nr:potassium channel family protein [Modestobacter sp. VKM Ac-2978]MCZ2849782.1 potassium channel family protein [Modestobacter sp. VKM Ac-2978]
MAAYYLVPVADPAGPQTALRAGATAGVLALAVWAIGREVVRGARAAGAPVGAEALRVDRLLVALVLGVLVFALADHVVASGAEGQFVGLETRTDALYFALSTLCTVGFGDVHATGQLARVLVSLQMVFDVAVLASAAQVVGRGLLRRVDQR